MRRRDQQSALTPAWECRCRVKASGRASRPFSSSIAGSAQQVAVLPIKDQNAFLIVNRASKADDAGGAVGSELVDLKRGIKRVADEDGMQETAGLLQERLQRVLDHVREQPGPGHRLDGDLVSMGKHVLQAARPTVLDIVMDRVVSPLAA